MRNSFPLITVKMIIGAQRVYIINILHILRFNMINSDCHNITGYSAEWKPPVRKKRKPTFRSIGNRLDLLLDPELEASESPRKRHALEL